MLKEALNYLGCPLCQAPLTLVEVHSQEDSHIMEGSLQCSQCSQKFPIIRGIPRLLPPTVMDKNWYERTIRRFGRQWLIFREIDRPFYKEQFLSFIHPVKPELFRDKVVLDAGCGKGRHVQFAHQWGAKAVIGLDLSDSVEAAFMNTRLLPGVHIVQGDLFHPPLQKGIIDITYSVGVLHHTPDPAKALQKIAEVTKPGGILSAWVYGKENNGWIIRFVNPVREKITSKMPSNLLYFLSMILAIPIYLMAKSVYRFRFMRRVLPYFDYIHHLSAFSFREIHSIVYDHLTPSIALYLSREEVQEMWRKAGIEPELYWRNKNSWSGFGVIPEREPTKV